MWIFVSAASILASFVSLFYSSAAPISLILLAVSSVLAYRKSATTPLLLLVLVLNVFILPRALTMFVGDGVYFDLFRIDRQDLSWVFALCCTVVLFVGAYLRGSACVAEIPPLYRPGRARLQVGGVFVALGVGVFLAYIVKMGGVGEIVNNYNPDKYVEITSNESLSVVKNLAIYFLVGGFVFVTSELMGIGKVKKKYIVFLVYSLVASVAFIKREYLFEVSIVAYMYLQSKGVLMSPLRKVLAGLGALCLMFGLYLVRSATSAGDADFGIVSILNTAEFWIFDEYVQVVQVGERLVGWDNLWRLFFSFLAPFSSFTEYTPLDWLLVEKATGVEKWGIPPTLFGYIFLVHGWSALLPVSVLLGYLFGRATRFLVSKSKTSSVWMSMYLMFVLYCWFVFRNGDPAIAVFYTNRIVVFVLLVHSIAKVVAAKGRAISA